MKLFVGNMCYIHLLLFTVKYPDIVKGPRRHLETHFSPWNNFGDEISTAKKNIWKSWTSNFLPRITTIDMLLSELQFLSRPNLKQWSQKLLGVSSRLPSPPIGLLNESASQDHQIWGDSKQDMFVWEIIPIVLSYCPWRKSQLVLYQFSTPKPAGERFNGYVNFTVYSV